MGETLGQLVSVNVGKARTVEWYGRDVTTGIFKEPVEGPVAVNGYLAGDEVSDLRVHGGADKAVYAYASEDYTWWAATMPERPFPPGLFGENLTTEGIDLAEAVVGEQWQVGSVVLEVRQPRFPCFKLGLKMGDASFKDTFEDARRSGTYFGVVTPGTLEAGDEVVRLSKPDHGLRIADLVDSLYDPPVELLERVLETPGVPPNMRQAAERALRHVRG
jgi:MOSC domain-containing protein YiiM